MDQKMTTARKDTDQTLYQTTRPEMDQTLHQTEMATRPHTNQIQTRYVEQIQKAQVKTKPDIDSDCPKVDSNWTDIDRQVDKTDNKTRQTTRPDNSQTRQTTGPNRQSLNQTGIKTRQTTRPDNSQTTHITVILLSTDITNYFKFTDSHHLEKQRVAVFP